MANTHFNSNGFRLPLLAVPFSQFYFRQYGAISSIVVSLPQSSHTVTTTHKTKAKSTNNKIPISLCEWNEKPKLRKKRFAMKRKQTTQKKKMCSNFHLCVWCFGCSRTGAASKSNSICFIRSTTKLDFSEVDVRCSHIRINTSLRSRSTVIRAFLPRKYTTCMSGNSRSHTHKL